MTEEQPNFRPEEMKMPTITPGTDTAPKSVVSASILITLTLVLLLILGGIYYWFTITQTPPVSETAPLRPTAEMNREPETPTATAQVESLGALSTSDEIVTIEADLEATNLDSLETELLQIEAELNAGL